MQVTREVLESLLHRRASAADIETTHGPTPLPILLSRSPASMPPLCSESPFHDLHLYLHSGGPLTASARPFVLSWPPHDLHLYLHSRFRLTASVRLSFPSDRLKISPPMLRAPRTYNIIVSR